MDKWKFIRSYSVLAIAGVGIIAILLILNFSWKHEGYKHVISSDGIGYYQYLPNFFITKTLSKQQPDKRFFNEINGKGVNKYFVGTAVSMTPFFILGHTIASFQEENTTGYSPPYHKAISLAGLFYLLAGLLFFRALLCEYEFSEGTIAVCILTIVFGTNLLAYSVLMPSMSHVYSFFWISGFLFFAKKYSKETKPIQLFWLTFFLGMVVLIRPLNGIILFTFPFLCGSWSNFKRIFFSLLNFKKLAPMFLFLGGILFIQSYCWFLQCDEWIVWSYGDEGFYFSSPRWREFLFSWRKGALIYTPVLFLSIVGIIVLWRKNKFEGSNLFFFFVGLVYLVSSWWNWYYGPSFGQRPLVEFYALSFVPVAFLYESIGENKKKVFLGIGLLSCFGLNLVQTYQYQSGIISSWDMNYKKYLYTFLKTSKNHQNKLGGNKDILVYNPVVKATFEKKISFEHELPHVERGIITKEDEGNNIVCDYSQSEFNFSVTIPLSDSLIAKRGAYLFINYRLKDLMISQQNEALFVVDISDSAGTNYHYGTFPIRDIPPQQEGVWEKIEYSIEIKELRNSADKIKLYIWNKEKEKVLDR